MPIRRACIVPGCAGWAEGGARCPAHESRRQAQRQAERAAAAAAYDAKRDTSSARGYGQAWRRARRDYLREHPECERCGHPARMVHHRRPIRSGGAVLPEAGGLESLCWACHERDPH